MVFCPEIRNEGKSSILHCHFKQSLFLKVLVDKDSLAYLHVKKDRQYEHCIIQVEKNHFHEMSGDVGMAGWK